MFKKRNKKSIISFLIIIVLISLTSVIIYQYNKYSQIEERLSTAYDSTNFQSSELYKLFATYSEANYLFNMYAINFNQDDLVLYNNKLDTIKYVIDSLSTLPDIKNTIKSTKDIDENIAYEFLLLKKQVDNLILFSKDSIENTLLNNKNLKIQSKQVSKTDEIIQRIFNDNSLKTTNTDTVVKVKQNLFNRVFRAKNDTLLAENTSQVHISKQMDIVLRKNIDQLIKESNEINISNLNKLKSTFSSLKETESELLMANFSLLLNLKQGIEKLRQLEIDRYTKNKAEDFLIYTKNTKSIRNQLILALSLMVIMVILIIVYQALALSYEKKLIKEKNYANEIAEEKTSTLSSISHEIRSPLNSLRGLVKILKTNDGNEKIDKEIINSLDHDITLINATVNDILSLSKLESGSAKISAEYFNIHTIIDDIINLHSHHANSKKLNLINNNQTPNNILIKSNAFRIKQILSNLITNAIKYTEKGEIKVTSNLKNNRVLSISVQDTGVGIGKDQLDQIFRKYYTVNTSVKAGGFGLGLYISKLLTEQIGGKITVNSSIGQGTIFTFELPIYNLKEIEIVKTKSLKDLPTSLKTVFIDDSKINLFFVQQLLNTKEDVHYFANAKLALDFITHNAIDIVVTDLKMPNFSGWDVLSTIKSNPSLRHIRVIVSTAEPLLIEENKGPFKFDAIIGKPLIEEDLVNVFEELSTYNSVG